MTAPTDTMQFLQQHQVDALLSTAPANTAAPATIPRELQERAAAEIAQIERQDDERTQRASLQPCRCGAAPRLIDREHNQTPQLRGAWVECRACGMSTSIKPTVAEAIATWQPAASAAPDEPVNAQLLAALQRIVSWDSAGMAMTADHIDQAEKAIAAAPAAPARPPLTPERIEHLWQMAATTRELFTLSSRALSFARAIEHEIAGAAPAAAQPAQDAVSAERAACAKVCRDEAMKLERKAQDIERDEPDEAVSLRATCWQLSVCESLILERGAAAPAGEQS